MASSLQLYIVYTIPCLFVNDHTFLSQAITLAQAMMAKPVASQMPSTVPGAALQAPTTPSSFGSYQLGLTTFGTSGLTPVPFAASPGLGASFGLGMSDLLL